MIHNLTPQDLQGVSNEWLLIAARTSKVAEQELRRRVALVKAHPGKSAKHAAGPEHDQLDHGNWAHGTFEQSTPKGGNGLSLPRVMALQTKTDRYQQRVYDAQGTLRPESRKQLVAPTAPKLETFATREEYEKAYKDYSKQWLSYAKSYYEHIVSDTGKELLDGSIDGVRQYVDAVVTSDWFKESFGLFGPIGGVPPVSTTQASAAGQFKMISSQDGSIAQTALQFKNIALKSETTILHEIAHMATAISATKTYEPHGVEFAKNLVYIASKMAGEEFAGKWQQALMDKGVPVGN